MKGFLLLSAFVFLNASKSCKDDDSVPSCIQQMIKEYQSKPKQNPPAEIYQYDYNGKKVYYVKAPCCDQLNMLYDAECNIICHPDGGLTGKGDGKCPDFNSLKTNEKV